MCVHGRLFYSSANRGSGCLLERQKTAVVSVSAVTLFIVGHAVRSS